MKFSRAALNAWLAPANPAALLQGHVQGQYALPPTAYYVRTVFECRERGLLCKRARRRPAALGGALAATLLYVGSFAPAAAARGHSDPWWKHAVIYEIYPRSFQDSNGDGIGDLNGITQRLTTSELGVDAIWIAPIYPSPQVDFGYDISDYENIDPQYGTLADFDRLVAEAKQARHPHRPGHGAESHLRQASVVHRVCKLTHQSQARLVSLARRQATLPASSAAEQLGSSLWRLGLEVRCRHVGQFYYHKFYASSPT